MPNIKLQTKDNVIIDVDIDILKCSTVLANMMEDCESSEDEKDIVPIPNVGAKTMNKIIEWATYHKDDTPSVELKNDPKFYKNYKLSQWDEEFLNVEQDFLNAITVAANYLNIKGLFDASCKAVANRIKGKSPEELRSLFNLPDDIPEEDKKWIRLENEMCGDF